MKKNITRNKVASTEMNTMKRKNNSTNRSWKIRMRTSTMSLRGLCKGVLKEMHAGNKRRKGKDNKILKRRRQRQKEGRRKELSNSRSIKNVND